MHFTYYRMTDESRWKVSAQNYDLHRSYIYLYGLLLPTVCKDNWLMLCSPIEEG